MPVLYGSPLSPFVRKVAVLLQEKGLPYTLKPVRPHDRDADFTRISPLGRIPAYEDERIALADSSVICFYLEKSYSKPALYPSDTLELARALWFEEFFDSGLFPPLSTLFFETWLNPQFLDKPTNHAAVQEARDALPPLFAYLESELKPDRWVVGESFSIADISLATGFMNLDMVDYAFDDKRYPLLDLYVKRILARPSFVACATTMQEFVQKMRDKRALRKG